MTRESTKQETAAIREMIDQRLKARIRAESPTVVGAHLDEDAICAFVEARLSEAESSPIIAHLVTCGACRRTTAQLVRLESQIPEIETEPRDESSPSRLRKLLKDLAARMVSPTEEDAVFAYESPPADSDQNANAATKPTESKTELEGHEK